MPPLNCNMEPPTKNIAQNVVNSPRKKIKNQFSVWIKCNCRLWLIDLEDIKIDEGNFLIPIEMILKAAISQIEELANTSILNLSLAPNFKDKQVSTVTLSELKSFSKVENPLILTYRVCIWYKIILNDGWLVQDTISVTIDSESDFSTVSDFADAVHSEIPKYYSQNSTAKNIIVYEALDHHNLLTFRVAEEYKLSSSDILKPNTSISPLFVTLDRSLPPEDEAFASLVSTLRYNLFYSCTHNVRRCYTAIGMRELVSYRHGSHSALVEGEIITVASVANPKKHINVVLKQIHQEQDLIFLTSEVNLIPIPVRTVYPVVGQNYILIGFSAEDKSQFSVSKGIVNGRTTRGRFLGSIGSNKGDSGGGVYTVWGDLIGINLGNRNSTSDKNKFENVQTRMLIYPSLLIDALVEDDEVPERDE